MDKKNKDTIVNLKKRTEIDLVGKNNEIVPRTVTPIRIIVSLLGAFETVSVTRTILTCASKEKIRKAVFKGTLHYLII